MIQRPGYRRDTQIIDKPPSRGSIKNIRRGVGNYTIQRPGAKAENPMVRSIAFNRLEVLDSENAGVVELGEKTLKKLFEVKLPDPTDILWLQEKNRLITKYMADGLTKEQAEAEIISNKPLGREQRTITKRQNISESNISVANKVAELKEEVDQGRVESRAEQKNTLAELIRIFNSVRSLSAMSLSEFRDLKDIAAKANIPSDRRLLGLDAVYVDKNYYDANAGKINMLFIGKLIDAEKKSMTDQKQYNENMIVKDFSKGDKDGYPAKTIAQMYSSLSRGITRKPRYLNLNDGGLMSEEQIRMIAAMTTSGFANPMFSISKTLSPLTLKPTPPAPAKPAPATPATPAKPAPFIIKP